MRSDRYKTEAKPKKRKTGALKFLAVLILLLLIAIPSAVYYSYKSARESLSVTFKHPSLTVEIGDTIESMDCVSDYEGIVDPSASFLDTDSAGEKKIVYTVSKSLYGGLLTAVKKFSFRYSVEDRTPPVVLWSGDGSVVERGTEFDIKNVVGYGDNADPRPDIKYDGTVDMDTAGSYPIHVTVTDASGNSTDWDMTVTVADSVPSYQDDSPGFPFSDFKEKYKDTGKNFGIDVSVWQGDIDFRKVKSAGCEFVIIRVGYSENGDVTIDKTFKQNLEGAKAAGIPVGLYIYSYDNNEEDVRKAASWIIDQLGDTEIDLPIAFDWEDFGQFQTYEMSFITLNRMYDAFAEELKSAGYDSMLYGSKNFIEKVWAGTDTRTVWLAHYTDLTDYKGPHRIWQASSSGRIDGISGAVDMNIMY